MASDIHPSACQSVRSHGAPPPADATGWSVNCVTAALALRQAKSLIPYANSLSGAIYVIFVLQILPLSASRGHSPPPFFQGSCSTRPQTCTDRQTGAGYVRGEQVELDCETVFEFIR